MNSNNSQEIENAEHSTQFLIYGSDIQVLQITLNRAESVLAEGSVFCHSSCDVNLYERSSVGDGILVQLQKLFLGEPHNSIKLFKNDGILPGFLTLSVPQLGKVIPVDISSIGTLLVQPGSFLCSTAEVALESQTITLPFTPRSFPLALRDPLVFLKASGLGLLFIQAGGMLFEHELAPGEAFKVELDCLIAVSQTCKLESTPLMAMNASIQTHQRLLQTAIVTGPGKVFLQSLPSRKLAAKMFHSAALGRGSHSNQKCIRLALLAIASIMTTLILGLAMLLLEEQILRAI